MTLEQLIGKRRKIVALCERGVDDEREAARRALARFDQAHPQVGKYAGGINSRPRFVDPFEVADAFAILLGAFFGFAPHHGSRKPRSAKKRYKGRAARKRSRS